MCVYIYIHIECPIITLYVISIVNVANYPCVCSARTPCEFLENLLHTSAKNHLLITKKVASAKSSSIIFLQFLYGFLHYFRVITWFYLSVQIHLELFDSILSAKEFHRNNYTCFFCLLNYACYYDHDPLNQYSGFLPKLSLWQHTEPVSYNFTPCKWGFVTHTGLWLTIIVRDMVT